MLRLLLEGPDGAGKTTLADTLVRRLMATRVMHYGPPPDPQRQFPYMVSTLDHPALTVVDRSFPSAMVYDHVLRREHRLSRAEGRMLVRAALGLNYTMVYCRPPIREMHMAWASRKGRELLTEAAQLDAVIENYDLLVKVLQSQLPVVPYDWTKDNVDDLLERCELHADPVNHGPGLGLFAANVFLLVGDRRNPAAAGPDWPFVHDRGASPWLTDRLDALQVYERDLYWVNRYRADGTENDTSWLPGLAPSRVVALGESALAWCTNNRIADWCPVTSVPHPSWWRRFQANKDAEYTALLSTALFGNPPCPS